MRVRGPAGLLILLCAQSAVAEMLHEGTPPTEVCRTVKTGAHESTPYTLPGFVDAAERSIDVRFLSNAADYACGCAVEPVDSCNTSSWNKLWGSSRCGFTHSHHQDSDRFVWPTICAPYHPSGVPLLPRPAGTAQQKIVSLSEEEWAPQLAT